MLEVIFFVLGTLFGSFANVLILRLPKNQNIALPRSYCFKCQKQIPWYLNIPIISFIILFGKTKCCNEKLNPQYIIVETLMGLLFLLNYLYFNIFQTIALNILFFITILIIFIDFNEKIIFDIFNYSILISGLLISLLFNHLNPIDVSIKNSIITALIGFSLFYILRLLFLKFRDIEALGFGDIYLIAGFSSWLGFEKFLYLLIISSLLGIIYFIIFGRKIKNFEIPFGSAMGLSFISLFYF
jgi:leader peptidase (prepilin peptidase)/N-methyltransferase